MKFIHTMGRHVTARIFVDTKKIRIYKSEIDKEAKEGRSSHREVGMRLVAVTDAGGQLILTPVKWATTKEDLAALQMFIVKLMTEINKAPDGAILRCFSDDEKEWDISVNTDACVK